MFNGRLNHQCSPVNAQLNSAQDLLFRRRALKVVLWRGLAAGLAVDYSCSRVALAQSAYPQRTIKLIVPNAPGSSIDTIGRILSTHVGAALSPQSIIVDNKAGAAGALGLEVGRAMTPDGYTLMLASSSSMTVAPLLQKAVKYDPLKDFDLIGLVALLPNVLVCNTALPVSTIAEFIAYAKAKSGALNMASAGLGSVSHLAGVALASAAGFESLHVPYKGGSQSGASVVSGETHWTLTPAPNAMSLVKAGRLKVLGHSMAKGASPIDDVPSIAETISGFEYVSWIGLVAPKGVPQAIADRLRANLASALQQQTLKESFALNGAVAPPVAQLASAGFREFLVRDIEQNRKVIRIAAVPME